MQSARGAFGVGAAVKWSRGTNLAHGSTPWRSTPGYADKHTGGPWQAERAHAAWSPAESCPCACAGKFAEAAGEQLLGSVEAESERESAKRREKAKRKAAKERRAAERRAEEAARKGAEEAERERVQEEQAQVPPSALARARVCRRRCSCRIQPARVTPASPAAERTSVLALVCACRSGLATASHCRCLLCAPCRGTHAHRMCAFPPLRRRRALSSLNLNRRSVRYPCMIQDMCRALTQTACMLAVCKAAEERARRRPGRRMTGLPRMCMRAMTRSGP